MDMQVGDTFTMAGIQQMVRNPDRKWWQLWKPRMVPAGLRTFRVVST